MKTKESPIKIFHNPRCSKSRTALCSLQESSQAFEVVEYLKNPPSKKELLSLLEALSTPPATLVRTKEPQYQKLKFSLENKEIIAENLAKYPELIERPVVLKGKHAIIARTPDDLSAAIKL